MHYFFIKNPFKKIIRLGLTPNPIKQRPPRGPMFNGPYASKKI